jgi:hypothetical protein
MKVDTTNNRIYFNENNIAQGNVTIGVDTAILELIKVVPKHRGKKLAKSLLTKIIKHIKCNFKNIDKITLQPLPLDSTGLSLKDLIAFYKKFKFNKSTNTSRSNPHMLVKYL